MRVMVDQERCQGHGLCAMNAPEVFALDDDSGRAVVLLPEIAAGSVQEAQSAEGNCPEGAISLIDEEPA